LGTFFLIFACIEWYASPMTRIWKRDLTNMKHVLQAQIYHVSVKHLGTLFLELLICDNLNTDNISYYGNINIQSNFMDQSPWEANICSASQEIPCLS
jgi:hypothetical protein